MFNNINDTQLYFADGFVTNCLVSKYIFVDVSLSCSYSRNKFGKFCLMPRFTTRRPVALPSARAGPVRVTSDLSTLEQTRLFAQMDPHQQQFISVPKANAG
jgi:hypothetical protein